jgi:hypothetical protein
MISFGEKPKTIKLTKKTGITLKTEPKPTELYLIDSRGWFLDSFGNEQITKLTTNPTRVGYTFKGYDGHHSIEVDLFSIPPRVGNIFFGTTLLRENSEDPYPTVATFTARVTGITSDKVDYDLIDATILHSGSLDKLHLKNGEGINSLQQVCDTNSATGEYSVALGFNTKSYGKGSLAEGWSTVAGTDKCNAAHAEGYSTQALGDSSHAEGGQTKTLGRASHAEGISTIAWEQDSHAEGSTTEALYPHSHAEGYNTIAANSSSHAEGEGVRINSKITGNGNSTIYTMSYNVDKVKVGYGIRLQNTMESAIITNIDIEGSIITISKTLSSSSLIDAAVDIFTGAVASQSHSEGVGTTASGIRSHAEGYYTIALGTNAHAEGSATEATKTSSHAEGNATKATADFAHAEGNTTTSSGIGAHAEGRNNTASGIYSHAEGGYTQATADYAHSGGLESRANAKQSFAHGRALYAKAENQFVTGQYNKDNANALFMVGNGESGTSRKNALEVLKDGRVKANGAPTETNDLTTKIYVDTAIANLLNSAPSQLDTLGELSKALGNDKDFATNVLNKISLKANTTYVDAEIEKVIKSANEGMHGLLENLKITQVPIISSNNFYNVTVKYVSGLDVEAYCTINISSHNPTYTGFCEFLVNNNSTLDCKILFNGTEYEGAFSVTYSEVDAYILHLNGVPGYDNIYGDYSVWEFSSNLISEENVKTTQICSENYTPINNNTLLTSKAIYDLIYNTINKDFKLNLIVDAVGQNDFTYAPLEADVLYLVVLYISDKVVFRKVCKANDYCVFQYDTNFPSTNISTYSMYIDFTSTHVSSASDTKITRLKVYKVPAMLGTVLQ